MATTGYFVITVEEEFYRNHYENVLRDLKAVPEVDSVERISGTCNLLVKVTAPMRVILVANKILHNEWVKHFCILKVEPFKPHDYEGFTIDELARLRGLIPKTPGSYEGLTVEEGLGIRRLIHESRGSHGAVGILP
ncbi:MAG: hypothetical protein JSW22_05365 [Chloroflexota bacterium]|nr:MAG: hypothetical protein JSW22_05365 [Chloroflexota bacterium]